MKMNSIDKMKEMILNLNRYRDAYYNESNSLISDREYDCLYDELERLEKETGIIFSNSPTCNVGYKVKDKLEKTNHSHPMLSLDKTKDIIDLNRFKSSHDCVLMHKLDGLTCLLTYENGKLLKAETRGDGHTGEDITHNAKVFENIPLEIDYNGTLELEGEAIIKYDDYENINSKIKDVEKRYKNPRNLVSGSVRQLDNNIAKKRHIHFLVWKVPAGMGKVNSFLNRLTAVKSLGFDIVEYQFIKSEMKITDDIVNQLKDSAKYYKYPIDGLVITYNNIDYGLLLGATEHHPKHSLAYKFYDEEYESKLINIDWTMGKSGQLTPTAVFEPIEIDGTIVSRASLHNISIMKSLLGKPYIGQKVYVTKRNMIIPQIERAEKIID